MAPSSHPQYTKDEKVLCFHHELLYEAKVLDFKYSDPNDKKSPIHYRVHYKGWKNTYVKSEFSHCPISAVLFICDSLLPAPSFENTSSAFFLQKQSSSSFKPSTFFFLLDKEIVCSCRSNLSYFMIYLFCWTEPDL